MDNTVVRTLDTIAMLVGARSPSTSNGASNGRSNGHGGSTGEVAEKVIAGFEMVGVPVVRVGHVAAACERLAIAMPQVVVVLESLRQEERDALNDRATAVGALVLYLDPELDQETLDELIGRAAMAALDRRGPPRPTPQASDDEDEDDASW